MKIIRIQWSYLFIAVGFLLVLNSCDTESILEDQITNKNDLSNTERRATKIKVCHFAKSDNHWNVINISSNALTAHLQHGDIQLIDADGDGFVELINECVPGGDCDDTNAAINPSSNEVCDGVDNNCDGNIDEGFDADGDGFTTCQGDCDDANPEVNPGVDEICGNGVDDNCNGQTDEECGADLIAYYRFNSNVADEKGLHNGTPTSITYATGKSGNAAIFNGITSFVSLEDDDSLSFTDGANDTPFSMSFWVYVNSFSSNDFLISKRDGSHAEYQLGFIGSELRFRLFGGDATGNQLAWEHSGFSTGTWYHITITYDGSEAASTSTLKLYIDGEQVTISTAPYETGTYTRMYDTAADLLIGTILGGYWLDGKIDGLGIWNKELTGGEVTSIYNTQNGGLEIF